MKQLKSYFGFNTFPEILQKPCIRVALKTVSANQICDWGSPTECVMCIKRINWDNAETSTLVSWISTAKSDLDSFLSVRNRF